MTQPDGFFPDNAFNLDSLAELAARPQSEWEAMIRGQTSGGFETFLSALFGPLPADLREGIEFTRALVTAIIRQILNLPGQIWDSVEDALAALAGWVADIPIIGDILTIINDTFSAIFGGIDFTGTLPTPGEVWQTVINTLMLPLNLLLGPGSALNAANLFGRIALGQFGSGVPIMALTTAVPNELEPFTAASVPSEDGWSFNASEDAAQVVCDGALKTLYLKSGVIKVEAGQPINTSVPVKYSGVVSPAGQTVRYVLETFTSDDGSGTATPVTVGAVTNPSGTITTPVTLGDTSWDIPAGVQSVRPALVVDGVTAGTVFWKNTPTLKRILAGPLAGGLPAAIQDRIDEFQQLLADLLTNPAGVIGTITQGMVSGLADLNTLTNQIRDILAGLVVTPINSTVQAIKDWFTGLTGKTSGLNSSGQINGTNIIGTIASGVVEGLDDIGEGLQDTWNKIVGGYRRTTTTGQTSANVEEVMVSVGQEILVAQESTITLANQSNAPKDVPFWVSPNRFEEVSFPRALLVPFPTYAVSNGGVAVDPGLGSLGTTWNATERNRVRDHTHQLNSNAIVEIYRQPAFSLSAGTLALTAITVTQDRLVNVVRFMTTGGNPPSTALYVGLYSINPSTGEMALLHDFGDQKGNIPTGSDGLYEVTLTMPNDILVDAGSMFAVGILPVGGAMSLAGIRRQHIVTSALIYPTAATERVTGLSSLPASLSASERDAGIVYRMWASVGQAVESLPEDTSQTTLTMKFNVADTSNWSSPSFWARGNANSNFTVADGKIYGGGPTILSGDVSYWRSALCLTSLNTDNQMAEITLGTGWDNNAYGYATDRAYVRCNSTGTSGVCLHVDATGGAVRVRIADVTDIFSPVIGTVRVTVTGISYVVGDRFSIRAVGNVYTAYRNDDPIPGATWTDSGDVVPVGKAWRRTAFGSGSRVTSGFNHYEPAHIDSFKAADIAA